MHPVLFHFGAILIPTYGAVAALGVLLALFLAQRTAWSTGINPNHLWNLSVMAVFAALAASRLLLVLLNLGELRLHPRWMLGLAMIHHPLLAAVGALAGSAVALLYARRQQMPLAATADALAAPLALGLAFEQLGALMAGSGYGIETGSGIASRWAVTYNHAMTALWSGAPLGVALHPVQGYAASSFLLLACFLFAAARYRHQPGDLAGIFLLGAGATLFLTEFWRDHEGRGSVFGGILDAPQLAAIFLVLCGGFVLIERIPQKGNEASHE